MLTERVHRALGPGLLETVYEVVLARPEGGAALKDGIERVVNGLQEERLGVLASLRETPID